MRMVRWLIAGLVGVVALLTWGTTTHRWMALVYPPGMSLEGQPPYEAIFGHYSTLDDCQMAASNILRHHHRLTGAPVFGDYECASACQLTPAADKYVCKEIVRPPGRPYGQPAKSLAILRPTGRNAGL